MDLEAWHEAIVLAVRKLASNGFKAYIAKPDGTLNIRKLFNVMTRDPELHDKLYAAAGEREPSPMHLRNALLRLAQLGYEPERTMVLKAVRGEPVDFASLPPPASPLAAEINLERTAVRTVERSAPGDRGLASKVGAGGKEGGRRASSGGAGVQVGEEAVGLG